MGIEGFSTQFSASDILLRLDIVWNNWGAGISFTRSEILCCGDEDLRRMLGKYGHV
jgi:hypothetical protein